MIAMRVARPNASPRRSFLLFVALSFAVGARRSIAGEAGQPDPRFYAAAESMRKLALSWDDQPYGAVVVMGEVIVGEGPSRVVKDHDLDAHAERVAIRDARRRLGRHDLSGAIMYSTSRPCSLCEKAAAAAGISRMYYGPALTDAGQPRG